MFLRTLLLFLCFQFPCCKSIDIITTTQPLNVNDSLFSKEKNFELHFFNPENSTNWYVGIRYAKLPEKAIVWVANRDDPVKNPSGVFLAVNRFGNLALYAHNNTNTPTWSTNISLQDGVDTSTITARLLDSGNLVLIVNGDEANPLWQSFDYPTDTMLPGMKLGLNRRTGLIWSLSAWKSENDPGTSDYTYRIDIAGSPQFDIARSPQFFLYKGSTRVWRSTPWPWTDRPEKLSADLNTYTYANTKDETYYMYFPSDPKRMTRMVVDWSGMLRLLAWNTNNDGLWDESWAVPKYRCDSFRECGPNSKCSPDNMNRFFCECLAGFEPSSPVEWDRRNSSHGCARKCAQSSSRCTNGDGFATVMRVNPPDTSTAELRWVESDRECENTCTKNCSCSAFVAAGRNREKSGCLMWFGDLVDVRQYTESGHDLHVRVNTIDGNPSTSTSFLRKNRIFAGVIVSAVSSLLFGLAFAYLWHKRKRKTKIEHKEREREPDLPIFHLRDIMAATENFSLVNKLGQGGFGSVHKGQLPNGQKIAVKRLSKSSGQGVEEFKNEMMLIAKLQHRNLVKLLGYCIEGEEKMLIYEYMPNKSLDSFIFDQTRRSCLDWKTRFDIIKGIARGVLYLHQDSRLRIIHRDLKASNVLLDAEMNPKISDFGMARIFTGDQIQDKTKRVVGTYGYMSPEYAVFGKFSTKSDVFSFGVILLEIISGTRNNQCYQEDSSITLIGHVWQLWKEDRALEIVDLLLESYVRDDILRCIKIALLCVQEEVKDRPTMSVVVLMLSSEITLPSPKRPAYMFRRGIEDADSHIEEQGLCSTNQCSITKIVAR